MARWASHFLSLLALLLFLATVAVWVRSYSVSDWIGRVHYAPEVPNEDHHAWLLADDGIIHLTIGGDPVKNFPNVKWASMHLPPSPGGGGLWGHDGPIYLRRIGIAWQNQMRLTTGEYDKGVSVRLPLVATVFGLATLLLARPWRWFLRRAQPGMCPRCHYDLRASIGRCPECGTPVQSPQGFTMDDQRPDSREEERPPARSFGRFLLLCAGAVAIFAAWLGAAIGAGSNLFPRPVRLGLWVIAGAPFVAIILYLVLDALFAVYGMYTDVKAAIDPVSRRKKIIAVIIASIFISAYAIDRTWRHFETGRHGNKALAAPPATSGPTLPAATAPQATPPDAVIKAPTTASFEAARAPWDAIDKSPPIIPHPTTQPAPH